MKDQFFLSEVKCNYEFFRALDYMWQRSEGGYEKKLTSILVFLFSHWFRADISSSGKN